MMAGNPNYWWGMYPQLSSPSHQFVYGSSSSTTDSSLVDSNSSCIDPDNQNPNQDFPVRSWSQLLVGGEEDKNDSNINIFEEEKKLENWEILNLNPEPAVVDVNQDGSHESQSNYMICQLFSHQEESDDHHDHANNYKPSSNNFITSFISPTSSTTTTTTTTTTTLSNNNIFNFSGGTHVEEQVQRKINHYHNREGNVTRGVSKKPRIQQSSVQEPDSKVLKVSKEKVRDRITTLHQIVSPFGKTDTASVLSEAIGFIRSLQAQIKGLSSPYMRHASESRMHRQQQDSDSLGVINKDLRSLGLCLVPISCTQFIGINDNGGVGADYWAIPTTLGGGGGF